MVKTIRKVFYTEKEAMISLLNEIKKEKVLNFDIQFAVIEPETFVPFSKQNAIDFLNGLINNIETIEIHCLYIETNFFKYNLFGNSYTKVLNK